ncbi:MPIP2 phosphatase, partial [Oenanthe oenanthe]|nr:MPIP2 phosphatase [Oenanthe oenanthe]
STQLEEIESLLASNDQEFIGDFSKPHLLPMVEGKDPGLKYTSPGTTRGQRPFPSPAKGLPACYPRACPRVSPLVDTLPPQLVAVLTGHFSSFVESSIVVDCRYPFEYEGSHVKAAINLPLQRDVKELLLEQPIVPLDACKRVIIIFHCECSVGRGPKMCKFLRERDWSCHKYPQLHYPELYVLNGVTASSSSCCGLQSHCEPRDYRPIEHPVFKEELCKFHGQSR